MGSKGVRIADPSEWPACILSSRVNGKTNTNKHSFIQSNAVKIAYYVADSGHSITENKVYSISF